MCRVCIVSKRFQSLTGNESLNFCLPTPNVNNSSSTSTAASNAHSSDASSLSPSVTLADLDVLKREILTEVRREISQAKQEIIEGRFISLFLRLWYHLLHLCMDSVCVCRRWAKNWTVSPMYVDVQKCSMYKLFSFLSGLRLVFCVPQSFNSLCTI